METEHLPFEDAERSVVVFFFVMGGMAVVSVLMGGSLTGAVVGLFVGFIVGEIVVYLWNRMVKQRQWQQIGQKWIEDKELRQQEIAQRLEMINEQMQKTLKHMQQDNWSPIPDPNLLEVERHPEDIGGDEK